MPPTTQQVAIVTDSSVSLPRAMVEEWGIQVAPLEVHFGDRPYRDGDDLVPDAFYQMLQTADPLPTTSAPKPASFLDAFRRASPTARHVVCLTLAARFSATYDSARAAAELARQALPELTIHVVDTHTAVSAEALVVLAAAKAARQGRGLEEVLEVCYSVMERVTLIAFLDTLRFVWRSGRIPWVAAWMGDALSVKPMLELKEDEARLVARPRTRSRATERLLREVERRTRGRPLVVNVVHAADPEGAHYLCQRVQARFDCREAFVSEFSPAIGVHTGPGLLGLAFYALEV
ncbi:MAG: DegV family protein [Chloroflexota bacterium]